MKQILRVLVFAWVFPVAVVGQSTQCASGNRPSETIEVAGVVTGSTGPLSKMMVIVFPLSLPHGKSETRYFHGNATLHKEAWRAGAGSDRWEYVYSTGNDGPLTMMNTRVEADEKGAFSMRVPKDLFLDPCGCTNCSGYRSGEMAIGVFKELGKRRFETVHELETIKFDPNAAKVDVGRLVFKLGSPEPINDALPRKP